MPYVHLVFTLPHELNELYGAHPRWVIDTLFASTAATLNEFAANARCIGVAGGTPAFSLMLHIWTQDLRRHLYLHAVMACGVLQDGRWHVPARQPDFLFPVQALSRVVRGKFLQALIDAHRAGASNTTRKARAQPGANASACYAAAPGWSTPRRRWAGRPRRWKTSAATGTARTSATSASAP